MKPTLSTRWTFVALTLFAAEPAFAQASLRSAGISVFEMIYIAIGVIGAIALLYYGLNWALGGILSHSHEPKKEFINCCIAVACAFAVPTIILAIKTAMTAGGASVGNL